MAGVSGLKSRTVLVRIQPWGPSFFELNPKSKGPVKGLGSLFRCQRKNRRVRIPYRPPFLLEENMRDPVEALYKAIGDGLALKGKIPGAVIRREDPETREALGRLTSEMILKLRPSIIGEGPSRRGRFNRK